MNIERIRIASFRAIKSLEFYPKQHNVFLGPNNTGKTAVLEALNLLLNPEFTMRSTTIDENDFYGRIYTVASPTGDEQADSSTTDQNVGACQSAPEIRIEAVLTHLTTDEEDFFRDYTVPWRPEDSEVVEKADAGVDPVDRAFPAIRVVFQGCYDSAEDDFACREFFVTEVLKRITESNTIVYNLSFSPLRAETVRDLRGQHPDAPVPADLDPSEPPVMDVATIDLLAMLYSASNALRKNTARAVADLTGGEHSIFKDGRSFDDSLAALTGNLRDRYFLSLEPKNPKPELHSIAVRLIEPCRDVTLPARNRYWALGSLGP